MSLDEIEPTSEMYVIAVKPDEKGNLEIRGRKYNANYVTCPLTCDENLIREMIDGCLVRWDLAFRKRDQKTKKIVAKVFRGFRQIFYSLE